MKKADGTGGNPTFRRMFGLSVALSFTLIAFEWSHTKKVMGEIPGKPADVFVPEVPPIDLSKLKDPIPTPKVKTFAAVKDEFRLVVEPDKNEDVGLESDQNRDGDTGFTELPFVNTETETAEGLPENLRYAEVMPVFGNCGAIRDENARAACSERNLSEYLKRSLKFPENPRRLGYEGTVFVKFIVDEKGNVTEAEILRGVHRELDQEALRVVSGMPRWTPGKQGAKPVRIIYQIGIAFKTK